MSTRRAAAPPLARRLLAAACRGLIFCDQLVRTTYLGLTLLLVLLGAATSGAPLAGARLALLALLAVCFHVHVYLMNDVIDLEIDATAPRRADHPLVRGLRGEGGLSRQRARAIAWGAAVLAALLCLALGASGRAWLALGAAGLLIGIYNVYGKRFALPPVTDAIQGLGWCALVLFGVFVAAPHASLAGIAAHTLPLLAFSLGFIMLLSGIHGGLRDGVNDAAHGRTNSALFLGAVPAAPGADADPSAVKSSAAVVAFAFAVLCLVYGPSLAFLAEPAHYASSTARRTAAVVTALGFAVNGALLWRVVRPHEPRRDPWVSAQAVALVGYPLGLYLPSALVPGWLGGLVVVLFLAPLGVQARFTKRWLVRLERADAPQPGLRAARLEPIDARDPAPYSGAGKSWP